MHEWINSADDVVAVIVSAKLTNADLEAMVSRVEETLARHATVHVYVETRSIDAIEIAGLGAYLARALPLFGKLRQFGRVAVVADQAWIRAGTRIESALLPFVSYRVFEPEFREEALAWARGGEPR